MKRFFCEWSSHVPVAVVNGKTGERFWFDRLNDADKTDALDLPVFDLSLRKFVRNDDGLRVHSFYMARKHLRM